MNAPFRKIITWAALAATTLRTGAIPETPRDVKSPPEQFREYRLEVKDAALGPGHSVMLLENGTLRCTGWNGDGQCEPPAGLTGVVQVVAGERFSAARDAAGKVTVWGRGPAWPPELKARWLATDGEGLGAILDDGELWLSGKGKIATGGIMLTKLVMSDQGAWALSDYGTLLEVDPETKKLDALTGDVVDLQPTGYRDQPLLALTKTGTLWLNPLHGTPEFGMGRISFIGSGARGCLVGFASGHLLEWYTGSSAAPEFVTGVKLANVKFVRSAYGKCLYALKNGRVIVTGWDRGGSLLLGTPAKPKKISSYDWSYFVIREDGEVVSFGRRCIEGANEVGPDFPVWRGGIRDLAIFAGSYFAVSDKLEAFGIVDEGLLDIPAGLKRVEQVEWGINWALARTADGRLVTWGNRAREFKLPSTKGKCLSASAGYFHGVSLYDDGSVEEWGDVPRSQSRDIEERPRPDLPEKITAVVAGPAQTMALSADGRVFVWGIDAFGLCDVPADLQNVISISAGAEHFAALQADGRLRVWGQHAAPAADTPNLVSIHAGRDVTVGITSDGKVVAISAANGKATLVPLYGVFDRP